MNPGMKMKILECYRCYNYYDIRENLGNWINDEYHCDNCSDSLEAIALLNLDL